MENISSAEEKEGEHKTEPTIVFISGLGGVGKTTLVDYFTQHPLEGWIFYDFDKGKYEIPNDQKDHLDWRKKQTDYWLEVALNHGLNDNLQTVIMGLSLYPEKTFELSNADKFKKNNIHFALINAQDEERKRRLIERGTPHHYQGIKEWYDEFFKKMRESGDCEFDTTNKTKEETAQEIKQYLMEI